MKLETLKTGPNPEIDVRKETRMKKMMMFAGAPLALLLSFAPPADAQCVASEDSSGTQCFTLYAGQSIDAGTVCVTVNGDTLDVTYNTTNGWTINETHLWVGSDTSDMPTTRKGNPIPGRFPYVSGDITGATSYTSSVLLSDLGFSCPGDDEMFSMAAHAAIQRVNDDGTVQTETGWSDGGRITDKGNWATLSTITLTCDCDTPPGPGDSCETAHAYYASQSTCFNLIDEDADGSPDFKKWGWSIGPLETGSYTFPLWAGAASGNPNDQECDTSKGTLVGDVQFHYNDDGTADVSYNLDAPYYLDETHLYVGDEILPRNVQGWFTVAPGQFTWINNDAEGNLDEYLGVVPVDNIAGVDTVHVVAHARVCGFDN